ncbi:hypothetical protein APH_0388 [Anaplasma phagocytophilum str. HZ]|uniref:Uncharacterized protein n=1 Tax=Anaplasma phagocytophilum (strain HZ) TaxID=212042 RepID=Q2GKV8_ANAPZ|nr:hypothetical protein APH_0388 [Anaplasma phagocytophilum str. HZ]
MFTTINHIGKIALSLSNAVAYVWEQRSTLYT